MLKQLILGVLITTITIAAGFSVYNTQAARQVQAQAAEPAPTLPAYTSVESDFQAADEAAVPAVMADTSPSAQSQSLGSWAGNTTENFNGQGGSGRAGQIGQGGLGAGSQGGNQGNGQGGARRTGKSASGSSGQGAGGASGRPAWAGSGQAALP